MNISVSSIVISVRKNSTNMPVLDRWLYTRIGILAYFWSGVNAAYWNENVQHNRLRPNVAIPPNLPFEYFCIKFYRSEWTVRTFATNSCYPLAKCMANHELIPTDLPQSHQPTKRWSRLERKSVGKSEWKSYSELRFTVFTMLIVLLLLMLRTNLLHSMLTLTISLAVHHLLIVLIRLRLINGHLMLIMNSTLLWIVAGIEFTDACTFYGNYCWKRDRF